MPFVNVTDKLQVVGRYTLHRQRRTEWNPARHLRKPRRSGPRRRVQRALSRRQLLLLRSQAQAAERASVRGHERSRANDGGAYLGCRLDDRVARRLVMVRANALGSALRCGSR